MRYLIAILASALAITAHGQNNALAQLGAKGVTSTGSGPAYANFIPRLGADGKLATGMLPPGLSDSTLSRLVYLDPVMGVDGAGSGSVKLPYKTLGYAVAALPQRSIGNTAYLLNPGTYDATVIDPVLSSGATDITIVGYGPNSAYIPSLHFYTAGSGVVQLSVNLSGVRVGHLHQQNNKPMILRLSGGAVIDTLETTSASAVTVYRDTDTAIGSCGGSGVYTHQLIHAAQWISYAYSGVPVANVAQALDRIYTPLLVIERDLGTWSNTWIWAATNWSGSVARQIKAADTNFWNWGVNDWTSSVAKQIKAADTNFWNWGVNDWTSSVARKVTVFDTNKWTWAVLSWSNSVAYSLTAQTTNMWTWTTLDWSNSLARKITSADTNNWTQSAQSWRDSTAYAITAADVARWNLIYISGANDIFWSVSCVSWTNSAAYKITGADTNRWNWAVEAWSNSVARQVTVADTNNWNWAVEAWSNSVARKVTAADTNLWTAAANGTIHDSADPLVFTVLVNGANRLMRITPAAWYVNATGASVSGLPISSTTGPVVWAGVPPPPEMIGDGVNYWGPGDLSNCRMFNFDGVLYIQRGAGEAPCWFKYPYDPVAVTDYTTDQLSLGAEGSIRIYWQPATTNEVVAVGLPLGPVISGSQSMFYTDGTNLFWRNVNGAEFCVNRPVGAVYSSTGITNLWTGTAEDYGALTPDAKTVYMIEGD